MLHGIPLRQKIIVMLAVMSGLFLASLDQTIVATALPRIVQEFNGLEQLSWVITAYILTSTVTVPISGKLSDIYGRRPLLLIGILIFSGASLLAGLSQDMGQLIVFRALQGMGSGILLSNAFAVIGDLFAPAERGRWQGLVAGTFAISSVVGPLVGGYLTDLHQLFGFTTNWRWNFLINLPIGLLSFMLIHTFMPQLRRTKERIDYWGAIFLAISLASFTLLSIWGGSKYAWGSWPTLALLACVLMGLINFFLTEKRAVNPILPLRFFRNPVFRVTIPLVFLNGVAFFGAILYIPLFRQEVQGESATSSGIALFPLVLGLALASITAGQIISKTRRYKLLAVCGMGISTLGLLLLSQLRVDSSDLQLVTALAVTGVGLGTAMPVFTLSVQNAFSQRELGVASASVQMARGIGSTTGIAILGSIFNHQLSSRLNSLRSTIPTLNGPGETGNLNVNTVQDILADQAHSTLGSGAQTLMLIVHRVQEALASSIARVFLVATAVSLLSFVLSFFLKEIPLRQAAEESEPPH